jgi:hypothetical protein
MIDKDLSYYTCNGIEFSSKVNACIYSQTVNKPVEWMFHNDVYSAYPWQIEPEQTLDELYDARARQLREQYDYLILSYSGGSDTNNILESFIRQDLHIDEIVTNHITKATEKFTIIDPSNKLASNFAAEHQLQAIPRLQYIYDKLPKTKITVLDVSDVVLNSMSQFDDVEWVHERNDYLSIGQLFRYNYFHFAELKKQFDKDKKVAIIVGVDKPRTVISPNDEFVLYFTDATANIASVNDFNTEYSNIKTELFYWSKDTAPLICKQAHVVKHWLEANPVRQRMWRNVTKEMVRLYHERFLRNILYTTWDDTWFQADKGTSYWNSEFDAWFHNDPTLSRELTQWKRGLEYVAQSAGDYIEYKNGVADGLKGFKHSYFVGRMRNV